MIAWPDENAGCDRHLDDEFMPPLARLGASTHGEIQLPASFFLDDEEPWEVANGQA